VEAGIVFNNSKYTNSFGQSLNSIFDKILKMNWLHRDNIVLLNVNDLELVIEKLLGLTNKSNFGINPATKTDLESKNYFCDFCMSDGKSEKKVYRETTKYFQLILSILFDYQKVLRTQMIGFKTKYLEKDKSLLL
jgi:hypothetical protein